MGTEMKGVDCDFERRVRGVGIQTWASERKDGGGDEDGRGGGLEEFESG